MLASETTRQKSLRFVALLSRALPMLFVLPRTRTAGDKMIGKFQGWITEGWTTGNHTLLARGILNPTFTALLIAAVIVILSQALTRWLSALSNWRRAAQDAAK